MIMDAERKWEIIESHTWEAGMMHVHSEDLISTAESRGPGGVECSRCGVSWPVDRTCQEMTAGCGTCGSDRDECSGWCLYEDLGD